MGYANYEDGSVIGEIELLLLPEYGDSLASGSEQKYDKSLCPSRAAERRRCRHRVVLYMGKGLFIVLRLCTLYAEGWSAHSGGPGEGEMLKLLRKCEMWSFAFSLSSFWL